MKTFAGVYEKGKFSLSEAIRSVKSLPNFEKTGAIALFIGVVRGETLKKEKVQKLELEAYEEKANEALAKICQDLERREGIVNVQIHHLLGDFNVGEEIVYVIVAGSHRKNVFPVLEEAVERYKKEAPIFKKEYTVDKEGKITAHWISESSSFLKR
ncbi:MAG: hypothetical protein C0193_01950 [Candidatus Bathyarchaeota archaeon]|nr:MAG: hypothetical protein C0193_01950 [Candidatus Bathyarchaeota archaeon]